MPINDAEHILREAAEGEVQACVLQAVFSSLHNSSPRPHAAGSATSRTAEAYLAQCGKSALLEVAALAHDQRQGDSKLKLTLERTSDGGALVTAARKVNDTGRFGDQDVEVISELGDLDRHVIRLPSGECCVLWSTCAPERDGKPYTPGTHTCRQRACRETGRRLCPLEVFSQSALQWDLLPTQPTAPAAPRSNTAVPIPPTPQRKWAKTTNLFACLGEGDQDEEIHPAHETRDPEPVEVHDLHGLTVAEALEQVQGVLDSLAVAEMSSKRSEGDQRHVHLVVGRGKHSEDGVAQIKPAVLNALRVRGVTFGLVRNNPGTVWVDADTILPLRLADKRVETVDDLGFIGDILRLLMIVQMQLRKKQWPRILDALASPRARSLVPATLFRGRCPLHEVQLPAYRCDEHQRAALCSIRHNVSGIQGPPGTGKTWLIVNMVDFGVPQLNTLITCVQNKALDPIVLKLAETDVHFLVVAGHGAGAAKALTAQGEAEAMSQEDGCQRDAVKLGAAAQQHTLSARVAREFPFPRRRLQELVHRVYRRTLLGNPGRWGRVAMQCVERRVLNYVLRLKVQAWWRKTKEEEILSRATVFLSTIDGAQKVHRLLNDRDRTLDVAIVDEAGTVPEWKMPVITGLLGGPELIVLVGDQKQLPPFSRVSRGVGGVSVLAHMERELPPGSIKMLRTQYRMPPSICEFVSSRFYRGELTTAPRACRAENAAEMAAIEWRDHDGHEAHVGRSCYNETELDMIVDLLSRPDYLAADQLADNGETAMVITPYAEQARRLQERLRDLRPDVRIMTVDSAQGSEADYILLSLVRSNDQRKIGHVATPSRVNVAISRTRKRLIVVGSAQTLVRPHAGGAGEEEREDVWHAFKKHADALQPSIPKSPPPLSSASSVSSMSTLDAGKEERYAGYKVKLCQNWRADLRCPFGKGCTFAHGEQELRCYYWTLHRCSFGSACSRRHSTEDLVAATKALRALPGPERERDGAGVGVGATVTLGEYL